MKKIHKAQESESKETPKEAPNRTSFLDHEVFVQKWGKFDKAKDATMPPVANNPTTYYYREKTSPCFLWTLVLAPCLMPTVWYVSIA